MNMEEDWAVEVETETNTWLLTLNCKVIDYIVQCLQLVQLKMTELNPV